MPESIRNFHSSPPPARLDRWDYSADIEIHILSLHADEILQNTFISNILRWFGFNWRIQLRCKNPYPANWSLLIDICISSWGTRPVLQRCNGINLVWGYTWNYQLSEAVIWLSDVNRAGVGWGLSTDGDLHRADYFSIIHLHHRPITSQRCQLIQSDYKGTQATPIASWLWRSRVVLLKCNLLVRCCTAGRLDEWVTFLVWGVLTCIRGHIWLLERAGDVRLLHSFWSVKSIFSKWLFLLFFPSAFEQMVKICNYSWTKYLV